MVPVPGMASRSFLKSHLRMRGAHPMAIVLLLVLVASITAASDAGGLVSKPPQDHVQGALYLGPGLAPIYGLVKTDADASAKSDQPGAGWEKPAAVTQRWDGVTASHVDLDDKSRSSGTISAQSVEEGDRWIVVWEDHVTDATVEAACAEAASGTLFSGSCSYRYGVQPPSSKAAKASAGGDGTPAQWYPSTRPQADRVGAESQGSSGDDSGDGSFPRAVAIRASLGDLKSLLEVHQGDVRYIAWDQPVHALRLVTQTNVPSWGLDRIDSRNGSLDGNYTYEDAFAGQNVNAYVVDSGILANHVEFRLLNGTSRVRVSADADFMNDGRGGADCDGHGTHVAGTLGAATYGVAKLVNLFSVRVLNCEGDGLLSGVLAGLAWVVANHAKPAVINLSLGLTIYSTVYDEAVQSAVRAGITVVTAAGNDNINACYQQASTYAINVGALNRWVVVVTLLYHYYI
eukprot:jgi/Mesvir1/486/Mv11358-RA.1